MYFVGWMCVKYFVCKPGSYLGVSYNVCKPVSWMCVKCHVYNPVGSLVVKYHVCNPVGWLCVKYHICNTVAWLNQTCDTDAGCPAINSKCFANLCLCTPGYFYSHKQNLCVHSE